MNIEILRCEFVRLVTLYVQRSIYGIECDLELLLARAKTVRNQLAILNESTCMVSPLCYQVINRDINKIIQNTSVNLCTKC